MLRHVKILVLFFFLFFFFSCSNKEDNTKIYSQFSSNSIGGNTEYKKIYTIVKDTLINWKKNKLIGTSESCNYSKFQIDSLLCFNNEKNKMISAILESECKEDVSDGIKIFYGTKINDQWYFFSGAYIVLPRENYQSDTHVPLSFDKLHQIAMKEVFSGYLIKDEKGNWQINERFFDELKIGEGGYWFSRCKTQEDVEKRVMEIVNNNWQKK